MRFINIFCFIVSLLAGCVNPSIAPPVQGSSIADTYVNKQTDYSNYLLLSENGHGVIICERSSGKLALLMIFDWSVNGNNFVQTHIDWTKDGKTFHRSDNDSTEYRVDGNEFKTRDFNTGKWIIWNPIKTDIFDRVSKATSIKFPATKA
jgi:hypothetical protein